MRVLVTGAKGYIGSNLCLFLGLQDDVSYEVVEYDITDGKDILNLPLLKESLLGCDAVVHLAATPGIAACELDPDKAWATNYRGAVLTAMMAKECGIRRFIFVSSAAAEDKSTVYGETKHFAEKVIVSGLRGALVYRLSNVYGGWLFLSRKNTVLARFYRALRNGHKVTITGDGSQTRDFVHVLDVCQAIHLGLTTKWGVDKHLDICTGIGTSIRTVADLLGLEYEFIDGGPVDLRCGGWQSPQLAAQVLGMQPKYRLIQDLLDWRERCKGLRTK